MGTEQRAASRPSISQRGKPSTPGGPSAPLPGPRAEPDVEDRERQAQLCSSAQRVGIKNPVCLLRIKEEYTRPGQTINPEIKQIIHALIVNFMELSQIHTSTEAGNPLP